MLYHVQGCRLFTLLQLSASKLYVEYLGNTTCLICWTTIQFLQWYSKVTCLPCTVIYNMWEPLKEVNTIEDAICPSIRNVIIMFHIYIHYDDWAVELFSFYHSPMIINLLILSSLSSHSVVSILSYNSYTPCNITLLVVDTRETTPCVYDWMHSL